MKRNLFLFLSLFLTFTGPARAREDTELDLLVSGYENATTKVGISVRSLGSNRDDAAESPKGDVYGYNARLPLNPASTMKIVTAAAALKYLGGGYSYRTLLATDQNVGGVIKNLYVKGVGDPSLTDERLNEAAANLAKIGVRKITGNVVVDQSYFVSDPPLTAGLRRHMAVNAALMVNPGFVGLAEQVEGGDVPDDIITRAYGSQKGIPQYAAVRKTAVRKTSAPPQKNSKKAKKSVRYVDPALSTGELLKSALQTAGIAVAGKTVNGDDRGFIILAEDVSPPLAGIVKEMNKRSSNFIAEMLLKSLAAERTGLPGSLEKGSSFLSQFLGYNGVPMEEVRVTSGSGLSRDSRLSARALTQVLTVAYEDESIRDAFVASLPVAGVDGTLRRRFGSLPDLAGNVRAKTGTLADTRSLAGYLTTKAGRTLAFAITVNGPGIGKAYQLQEQFLQKLFDEF